MQQQCPSKFSDGLSGAHTCAWSGIVMGEQQVLMFFLWDELTKRKQLHFIMFKYSCRVYCCLPRQEGHKDNTFLIPKHCSYDFSCWWHTLTFLLLMDVVWHHSTDCCLNSDSIWWIQVSSHDNLQQQALSSCIISVQTISGNCPLPTCVHVLAFMASNEHHFDPNSKQQSMEWCHTT